MMQTTEMQDRGAPTNPAGPSGAAAGMGEIWLRRDGKRPIQLHGICLVEAGSWQDDLPFWHEIGIFQLQDGSFAASLKTFFKDMAQLDVFRAERFASAHDVVTWLHSHDPADDLPIASAPQTNDVDVLTAWRDDRIEQIAEIRDHYHELLDRLLPQS